MLVPELGVRKWEPTVPPIITILSTPFRLSDQDRSQPRTLLANLLREDIMLPEPDRLLSPAGAQPYRLFAGDHTCDRKS